MNAVWYSCHQGSDFTITVVCNLSYHFPTLGTDGGIGFQQYLEKAIISVIFKAPVGPNDPIYKEDSSLHNHLEK